MKRFLIVVVLGSFISLGLVMHSSYASEVDALLQKLVEKGILSASEAQAIRTETNEEIAKRQQEQKSEIDNIKETLAHKVDLDKLTSKLKIKGRWAAGFYDSGKNGSYPNGSFEAPEAKLQFNFSPDDINTLVMRLDFNNATFNKLDYFHLDTKLSKFFNLPFELNSRIGKMKVDFGEETWSNNPVESVLASNSAANVSGYDIGVQLGGKIVINKARPMGWTASVTNGNGAGSDSTKAKAFSAKVYYDIIDPLHASISYYDSGSMRTGSTGMSIAGLTSAPSGATDWERRIWEGDLRYDFGKGKKPLDPPAYSDSKAFVRFAYGGFSDEAKNASNRIGQYGLMEGTYNLTKKFYTAARYSLVALTHKDAVATLNSVTAHKYQRYSLGVGYRLTDATIIKLGYDWNLESGNNVAHAKNNQVSAIVASQF